MLAYAQLLVTRSRGGVGTYFVAINPLLIMGTEMFYAPSWECGLGGLGSSNNRLTAVRGQDKMTAKSKFGYGDPSRINQSIQYMRNVDTDGVGFMEDDYLKEEPKFFLSTKIQEVVQLLKQDVVMLLNFKLNAQEQVGNLI